VHVFLLKARNDRHSARYWKSLVNVHQRKFLKRYDYIKRISVLRPFHIKNGQFGEMVGKDIIGREEAYVKLVEDNWVSTIVD
jgi:hypothetical protein